MLINKKEKEYIKTRCLPILEKKIYRSDEIVDTLTLNIKFYNGNTEVADQQLPQYLTYEIGYIFYNSSRHIHIRRTEETSTRLCKSQELKEKVTHIQFESNKTSIEILLPQKSFFNSLDRHWDVLLEDPIATQLFLKTIMGRKLSYRLYEKYIKNLIDSKINTFLIDWNKRKSVDMQFLTNQLGTHFILKSKKIKLYS